MKLQFISESGAQDRIKELLDSGKNTARTELEGHVKNPEEAFWLIMRGSTRMDRLILSDDKYWKQMFELWLYVPPEDMPKYFEEVTKEVQQRLQKLSPVQVEFAGAAMKAAPAVIAGATRLLKFLATTLPVILQLLSKTGHGRSYGRYGGSGGTTRNKGFAIGTLNSFAVQSFVKKCVERSQQEIARREQSPGATEGLGE